MKYAVLNAAGQGVSYYDDELHGARSIQQIVTPEETEAGKVIKAAVMKAVANPDTTIPENAVELTDAQFSELSASNGTKALVKGKIVNVATAAPALTAAAVRLYCTRQLAATQWTQDAANTLPSKPAFTAFRAQLFTLLQSASSPSFDPSKVQLPNPPSV